MPKFKGRNVVSNLFERQLDESTRQSFAHKYYVTAELIHRLSLDTELTGHMGCVNCLQWNSSGSLLASGSDDCSVVIWDPFQKRQTHSIKTGHTNNIFAVQFMPDSGDRIIVSGAGDNRIRVHDVNSGSEESRCTNVFACHMARVKRIAVSPLQPNLFWSAGEDGTVMQFDLREPHSCDGSVCPHVLINLNAHVGHNCEVKCVAINPCRPELIAVGANDPYVRVYDRRMLRLSKVKFQPHTGSSYDPMAPLNFSVEGENYDFPHAAVQYFVPGHLPVKSSDFKRRHRPLATTYLTFSPCGRDLLVNLGGEQIYLFSLNGRRKSLLTTLKKEIHSVVAHTCVASSSKDAPNGTTKNGVSNGHIASCNGTSKRWLDTAFVYKYKDDRPKPKTTMCARAEVLKQQANSHFEKRQYSVSIGLYSQAICIEPKAPVLYSNRAAAFLKRDWDGDVYAALRDCHTTVQLDPSHFKAHFRLARCLFELKQIPEARGCLELFRVKFPDSATLPAYSNLDRDINSATMADKEKKSDDPLWTPVLKRSRSDSEAESSDGERPADLNLSRLDDSDEFGYAEQNASETLSAQEVQFRSEAHDYECRYCGHCNTTTDIKEANFFGSEGEYIVAGSDDGSFFIWDRSTCNIVKILKGDESIVNCLQPHPTQCLLATSGIEPVVRLWTPQAEGIKDDRLVADVHTAAGANQKRMNADPLEVMLINMGYRISGVLDSPDVNTDESDPPESSVRCTQS